jgi:glutamyl-tRNA synthetase
LFEVLRGLQPPIRFGHVPALGDSDKSAPSGRRAGNLTLRGLRNDGIEPSAIAACMTGIVSENGEPLPRDELAKRFELADLAASRFDVARMLEINRRAVAGRLPGGATEAFWLAVRGRLDLLKEARGWWDVVAGTIVPPEVEGERDLLLMAGSLLPPEPWDSAVWTKWIAALEHATGRIGDGLLTPLRLALTGEDSGPDLADLLPLIGRPRASSRLAIAAA